MRDLHNRIKTSRLLSPAAAIATDTTTTSQIIDTAGFDSLELIFQSGVLTDGTYTPAIYEGDASNMSDETLVAAADLIGTIAGVTFAATDDNVTKKIGYKGGKRYVRAKVVSASTSSGGFLSAVAVQSHGIQSGVGSAISP